MKTAKIVFIGTIISFCSFAQEWRCSLYPASWTPPITKDFYDDAFLQDYSYAGYQRGEVVMPDPTGKVFDVTKSPYNADKTGNNDATAAIQKAIDDAQTNSGGIVYLPTGTYKVNPGSSNTCLRISKSNIYLKGDGIGKTFILNTSYAMNNKRIITVSGSGSWLTTPSTKALLTADVMNPINVIPVDNTNLFKPGDMVIIRNEIGDPWITEHKEPEWLGYGSNLEGIIFCRYVTSVDATKKTITIDVPVRYALKTRDAASVFKQNGMIREVGLIDFSIGNVQHPATSGFGEEDYKIIGTAANDCHGSFAILFQTTADSWIKNVATYKPTTNTTGTHVLSNGIMAQYCKNITFDNCSISNAQYGGGGGNGYAYRVSSNEVLISNSASNFVRHGFVYSSMWCSGNVIHKCQDLNSGKQCGNTGSMNTSGMDSDHHQHFSQSNLIDNSYCENSAFVAYYRPFGSNPKHNLTSTHSAFWNIASAGTRGYCVWTQQSRYGYAIGSSGSSANLRSYATSSGSATKTNPVDIVEGQGQGLTLVPQSLYDDQLKKRLAQMILMLQPGSEDASINEKLTFSPNPFHNTLHLSANTDYSFYDISGTLVETGNCTGNCEIGGGLKAGIYVLEIQNGYLKKRNKVVKQ